MMSKPPKVLLRFDASKEIGVGHAMRCLTLGEELAKRGVEVEVICRLTTALVSDRAARLKIPLQVHEGDRGADEYLFTSLSDCDFAIVDGYQFKQEFFDRLDQIGKGYATVIDYADQIRGTPRLVINPNPGAQNTDYLGLGIEFLAVGLQYVILRPEILRARESLSITEPTSKPSVLVSIGGTDPEGIGSKIAQFLSDVGSFRVIHSGTHCPPGVERAPTEIAELLSRANFAVVGAGASMIEMAFCGTAGIGLVVADNQLVNTNWVSRLPSIQLLDARRGVPLDKILSEIQVSLSGRNSTREDLQTRDIPDGLGVFRIVDLVMKNLRR